MSYLLYPSLSSQSSLALSISMRHMLRVSF